MVHRPIVISLIAPVAVTTILILAMQAAISSTNQAFAYSSYQKGHHSPGHYKSPGRTYTTPHISKSPGRTYTTPHISKSPGRTYTSM